MAQDRVLDPAEPEAEAGRKVLVTARESLETKTTRTLEGDEAAALDPRQVEETFRCRHGPVLDADRFVAGMLAQCVEIGRGEGVPRQHGRLVGGIEVPVDRVADEPELPRGGVVHPDPERLQAVSREVHAEMLPGLLVGEDGDGHRDVVDGPGLYPLQFGIEPQPLRLVAGAGAEHDHHENRGDSCKELS